MIFDEILHEIATPSACNDTGLSLPGAPLLSLRGAQRRSNPAPTDNRRHNR